MYRFGWRKADKIEYYSEFLGVSDEIADADMILGEDRDKLYKLETENKETRKQIESQGEQILALEKSNKEMRQSSEDFLKEIKEQHYIESKERIKEIAKHIK